MGESGKSQRRGLSLPKLFGKFPDDEAAERWIKEQRWPDGAYCPHCGSFNVQVGISHPCMTHRCRDCPKRPMFSLKTGTVMEGTKLGYRTWVLAMYLMSQSPKGVSSLRLHEDLGITQKTAWHLAHRLRKAYELPPESLHGPVEVDETYIGGLEKNKHSSKRTRIGGGSGGKAPVVGIKDRQTNEVRARAIRRTDKETLQGFIVEHVDALATVYTDEYPCYATLPYRHSVVKHSAGQYVDGDVHTNGIESFWATFKRGYKGVYHWMSVKHLNRYVQEFAGRHNARDLDAIDRMARLVVGLERKRLRYKDLVS